VVHLSPAVQKVMNAMIEMRLAQAARLTQSGGQGGMSEEDRAEIARNEATIQRLHEEVKRVRLRLDSSTLDTPDSTTHNPSCRCTPRSVLRSDGARAQVKAQEEARAQEYEAAADKLRRELKAERAAIEQQKREMDAEKRSMAASTEQARGSAFA